MIVDIQSKFYEYKQTGTTVLTIKVSYYNTEGNIEIIERKVENAMTWGPSRNDKENIDGVVNWDGKGVKRIPLKTKPNKFQLMDIIHDHFTEEELDLLKTMNQPKIQSIDIEVEVIDGFPDPETAKERITTIAIAMENNKVMVIGWRELSHKDLVLTKNKVSKYLEKFGNWEFNYKKFDDEVTMMKFFIGMMMPKMSLIIGWNYFGYDWAYIVNRCKRIGIDVAKASPVNMVTGKNLEPMHIGMIDYLEIYKKHDRTVKVKESNKLDFVAEEVLGVKKLKYTGTLKTLFEDDFPNYAAYNAIDAVLVLLIHEKIRTIDTPLTLANQNFIPLSRALSPVYLGENMLYFGYRRINRVVAIQPNNKSYPYEGGYVKEPKAGMYTDIFCCDFASLYPSIMRMLNLSPESYVGIFTDEEVLKSYRQDENYIVAINGAVFDRRKVSVLKKLIDDLYADRRKFKNRYLEIKKFLNDNGITI
jgi:DNA polymerase elongation subunit (family B)